MGDSRSMADLRTRDVLRSTTHRGLITCVIEHQLSWRQSLSCDLNQVLSLREFTRSACERSVVPSPENRHKV